MLDLSEQLALLHLHLLLRGRKLEGLEHLQLARVGLLHEARQRVQSFIDTRLLEHVGLLLHGRVLRRRLGCHLGRHRDHVVVLLGAVGGASLILLLL